MLVAGFLILTSIWLDGRHDANRFSGIAYAQGNTATLTPTPGPTRIPFKQFAATEAGLLGVCQGVNKLGLNYITWGYPSGEVWWSDIEPYKGVRNWDPIDHAIETVEAAPTQEGRRNKIWLQILANQPGEFRESCWTPTPSATMTPKLTPPIPNWAVSEGVMQSPDCDTSYCLTLDPCEDTACGFCNNSKALQWDATFHVLWNDLISDMANRYDNNPHVEAILIMAGGEYGEMGLSAGGANPNTWNSNPDSFYVKAMATAVNSKYGPGTLYGGDAPNETLESLTQPYADPLSGRLFTTKFDYYYVRNTWELIDMYHRHFRSTPIVVQLGSGLSTMYPVTAAVADYAVTQYGKSVWLKQNGWGNTSITSPSEVDPYASFFAQYSGLTRTSYEGGHPPNWCGYTPRQPRL